MNGLVDSKNIHIAEGSAVKHQKLKIGLLTMMAICIGLVIVQGSMI